MACGRAFDDALAMARDHDGLGVGVHLTLTELPALSRPGDIPGLVNEEGLLPSSPGVLLKLLLRGKVGAPILIQELSRQVERVLDSGITPTHLDSHKHVHVLPHVLEAVLEVARRYSIRCLRSPFDRTSLGQLIPVVAKEDRLRLGEQHLKARLLNAFEPYFSRRVRRAGLRTPEHFHGVSLTGIWSEAAV